MITGKEALETLETGFRHSIKDPLWGNIQLTRPLRKLLETEIVEKLSRIKQNGPVYHIYPGAVHTRFNHSLGVYHLGREMLVSLARKSRELPFTEKGMRSFLVSCLLHDIGHFPYAHSLKELPIREHEEIARSLITSSDELGSAIEAAGADIEMTSLIIDKKAESSDRETEIYRSMLSGTLDPDKLDYLSRDAFFAGIPYGRQDTDFIISSLSLVSDTLAIDRAAISSVEQVLFSKYMMYKTVYWHKGVRSATAMVKKAVLSGLEDGVITPSDLYLKDDEEFYSFILSEKDYEPFELVKKEKHGQLFERASFKEYREGGRIEVNAGNIIKRKDTEMRIFSALSTLYPDLKASEAIIDIPEPVNFETDIHILSEDGSLSSIKDEPMIFHEAGAIFAKRLRTVSLYLPPYVRKEDAERAFREETDE